MGGGHSHSMGMTGGHRETSFSSSPMRTERVWVEPTRTKPDVVPVSHSEPDFDISAFLSSLSTDVSDVFNRDTNISGVSDQGTGDCYAHAATNAYINTCARIYGCDPPSYSECLKVAAYSHKGGRPEKALELLENRFRRGVKWRTSYDAPKIRDVVVTSVILSFGTSDEGWKKIGSGELINAVGGELDGRHASLIESYDFDRDLLRCKNSWGGAGQNGRFFLDARFVKNKRFIHVYFTTSSIRGKGYPTPNFVIIPLYDGVPKDERGRCKQVLANATAAKYSSDYYCQEIDSFVKDGVTFTHKGTVVEMWISWKTSRTIVAT